MVRHTSAKLLLTLYAIGATAQQPTIIAKPANDYKISDGPNPTGSDIITEPDTSKGTVKIFLGPDRASDFKRAVDTDCGNAVDAKCIESAQKALGMIPNEDGLHKRIIPLLVAGGVVVVGMLIEWIYLVKTDNSYVPAKVALPTPTGKDQDVWATATDVVYKPSADAQPTKVSLSGPAAPTVTPQVETTNSGDTVCTFPPGSMKMWMSSAEQVICPRSLDARDDPAVPVCLRRRAEMAIMTALLSGGFAGMELIHLPQEFQVVGNPLLANLITSLIPWAKTFKTLYNEADLKRLVQIIAIFIWETFKDIDVAGDVLTVIEIELNRMTLKKGKVKVAEEEKKGCGTKFDAKKDLPGFEVAFQQIVAAIAADPNWESPDGGLDPNTAVCPQPDPKFSDTSLKEKDVEDHIKKFCADKTDSKITKDRITQMYGGGVAALFLSVKVADGDCGNDVQLSESDCVSAFKEGLTKCTKDGKIFGANLDKNCISYSIRTDGNGNENDTPWDEQPKQGCSKELTNVQHNFFSGVYPAFCKDVGKDRLAKTLTNADYKKGSRKRAPPVSASSYEGFDFNFQWSGGENCETDCYKAFSKLTGLCGAQTMTERGSVEIGCGTYSYQIVNKAREKTCNKESKEVREDNSKWAWGQAHHMDEAIEEFCKLDFKDQKYSGKVAEENYDHGIDSFKLRLEFKDAPPPSQSLCKEFMKEIVHGCDGNAKLNQHNVKWGGKTVHTSTGNVFQVIPTQPRVATSAPNWECNTWHNRDQKGNKGKNGEPLPEKIDDQMMKLQCVHQYFNMGWVKDSSGDLRDCGGHYNIVLTGSNGYANSQDCWRYNFPCISDSIVNQGGVVMTGTHWAGSAGHVKNHLGIRCWIGFDNY